MKKMIIFSLLLSLTILCFAQQNKPSQPVPQTDYLKKSRNQKVAAWVLTAGAGAVFLGAASRDLNQLLDEKKSSTGLYILSGAMLAGGITLFIASSKNKRKGITTSAGIETEKLPALTANGKSGQSYPAVAMRINF